MACTYSFDGGKTYISEEQFKKELSSGKFDEFINDGNIELDKLRGGMPPTEPPITENIGVFVERPKTELSYRGLQNVANEFGYEDVKPRETVKDIEEKQNAINTAQEWASKGEYQSKVDDLLDRIEKRETIPTAKQRLILQDYLANEVYKLRQIKDKNSTEFNEQLNKVERIKDIGQIARGETGAALRIGGDLGSIGTNPLEDYADAYIAMKEASGVDELTPEQKEKVDSFIKQYEERATVAEARVKELEAKQSEIEAEKQVKKAVSESKKQKKSTEQYKKEREGIVLSIKEKWDKASKDGVITAVPVPYAKQLAAIAPDVAKLLHSYADQGVRELGEMVKLIGDEIRGFIPEITDTDVRDIIAGVYNEKRPKKSELERAKKDLRDEAALINKLERLLEGKEPKTEREKVERNKRITELKDKIKEYRKEEREANKFYGESDAGNRRIEKMEDELQRLKERREKEPINSVKRQKSEREIELQKQIDNERKNIREENKLPSELVRIRNIKSRNQKQEQEIQKKIENKDFEPEEKPVSIFDNPELKKKYPKEYGEMLDAIRLKNEAEGAYHKALLDEQLKNETKKEKAVRHAGRIVNTVKAIKSGIDASGIGIQTLLSSLARPKIGGTAILESAKQGKNKQLFDRWLTELQNSEMYPLMQQSGLSITEPSSLKGEQEEQFSGRYSGKIKFKGKEYKALDWVLTPFERAFTSLGNISRVMAFEKFANKYMEQGNTFENNPELFKSLARRLNAQTGRGKLNDKVQEASDLISKGIWSPRLMASRFEVLGIADLFATATGGKAGTKGFYSQLSPQERKQAIKDITNGIGAIVAVSAALALSTGGELDKNPLSPTFMTIKWPNGKSVNITGGLSGYIRDFMQFASGREYKDGKIVKKGVPLLGFEKIGRFLRGKAQPLLGSAMNIGFGKDYIGRPTTLKGEALKSIIPISVEPIVNGLVQDGVPSLLETIPEFIPSAMGFNIRDSKEFDGKDEKLSTLIERNKLNDDWDSSETINYKKGGKPITEAEKEKYIQEWNKIVEARLKKLWEGKDEQNKFQVNGRPKTVPYSEMSRKEIAQATTNIKSSATRQVKKKLFGEKKSKLKERF